MVDPSVALEMLVNLIENAHNVSPGDQPIVLRAVFNPEAPGFVRFEVLDRGPGIDESFVTGASSATPGISSGRGLGLEIVRSLARLSGGRLEFHPRDGGGTIARIDIPAAGGDR
jgi:signal transduction histidine kinase